MKNKISNHAEEYLEAIYRLEKEKGSAKTMELVKKLKVVPGSITNTIENLEKRGFVIHQPYLGVKLTKKGRDIATDVLKRHRLAERLLTDFLKLDWSQVHDAACKLEHAIPPEVIEPLENALGNPTTCPHGNLIHLNKVDSIDEKTKSLSVLDPGDEGIIVRITSEESNILERLGKLDILPTSHVKVTNDNRSVDFLEILVNGKSRKLDPELAVHVQVKPLSRGGN
ncbi:MAG: metal-dependent transcriptional regulator [Candidatus Bathyarchaeota archaeon]|jgi:DtxR family Mn-dependent transcriptional regulator